LQFLMDLDKKILKVSGIRFWDFDMESQRRGIG
jgi:hypothetical protein